MYMADNPRRRFLDTGRCERGRPRFNLWSMPAPRHLLLVAAPAPARDAIAPVRRFRLGRVLMGVEELLEGQSLRSTSSRLPATMRPRLSSDSEPSLK